MTRRPSAIDSAALDEMLCFDLYAASRALTRRYRPLLAEHDLTYPQYLVIVVVGASESASIKDLAGALRLDHATLTPLLRRLEAAGLLTRETDAQDRRSRRFTLTERGRQVHADSDAVQCRIREELGLTPDEMRDLQLRLRRVAASAQAALGG